MTYINHIYLENAETGIKNHIPDGVIDCCISSPPYWGLRSYLPGVVRLREDAPEWVKEKLKELCIEPIK